MSLIFQNKIRFFYTIHSEAQKEVKSKLEKLIRHYFFKHNFIIPIAISDETKKSYESFYKLNNAPVIYNGRKYTDKSPLFVQVVNEIDKLKRTRETLVFCHPAVYAKLKNQKMLISVFNKLRNKGYDVILLIMGEGFENQAELKAMANDHIHFLGIKSNVSDYLYASDAFCLSSEYEGMPISLIEAFASGCIPICTPVGGCINTIEHSVTGFLSKTVSEESYQEAIQEFIKNRKSINKENLIRCFHENFSIELCTCKYMKLYSK